MKIRNGFVSNSSSSSFIIGKEYFPTIWDVAIAMLALRDYRPHYYEDRRRRDFDDNYDADDINKCLEYKKEGLKKENIAFSTTNYSTYIHDADDTYWIATCNNHPFWLLFGDKLINYKENILSNNEYWNINDYIEFQLKNDYNYFDIRTGDIYNED